ncbi:CynX/NimT family MFS transporter [Microbacterium sp. ZW T2_14]|uniref:MFS transporter n=1 Tax=Microbacterium sp. ZW T2_14 TaxID=3378079 RepID=UPI003853C78C
MSSPSSRPLWQGRALALVGIVLFAFSLRSAVASLSPLYDHIAVDFDVPAAVIGLIGTAPPVCYAVFGLLTPALERRFGLERLAVVAMVVVAIGLIVRSLAPGDGVLLAGTALIFAAVGVGNILLPPLVKRYFPDRVGLMTTVFSTTMALATFLPPLVAVPVADASDWHVSLGLWAVFAVVATVPWIGLAVRHAAVEKSRAAAAAASDDDIEQPSPRAFGRMWRLPIAWALLVGFAVSSTLAYTAFAWLPTILVDIAGVTPAVAGVLLALFGFMGLPASLAVPLLVTRANATRVLFGVAVGTGLAGIAGLLFVPTVAPWLWVALFGLAPLLFPMILVLLGLRTRTHEGAVALSGFVQSGGYAIAALFPVGIGLLHDATDSWTAPLIVLAAVVAAAIPAGVVAAQPHTVEDDWERRHGAW